MQWSDDVRIETPEQIDVDLEIAGVGSRFVAQVMDWLIKWGAMFVIAIPVLMMAGSLQDLAHTFLALLVVLFYALLLGFDIYFEFRNNGQTPGKKFAGIRVVREGGAPLDFTSACVRNLLGLVDFLPVCYLLGGFLAMVTPRGQRLGDLAAGTIVIRERVLHPPAALEDRIQDLAHTEFTFLPDHLRACVPSDRFVLGSFFQRSRDMAPSQRGQLALRLTGIFLEKTGYQPALPIHGTERAEAFLATLYQALDSWTKHDR